MRSADTSNSRTTPAGLDFQYLFINRSYFHEDNWLHLFLIALNHKKNNKRFITKNLLPLTNIGFKGAWYGTIKDSGGAIYYSLVRSS